MVGCVRSDKFGGRECEECQKDKEVRGAHHEVVGKRSAGAKTGSRAMRYLSLCEVKTLMSYQMMSHQLMSHQLNQ